MSATQNLRLRATTPEHQLRPLLQGCRQSEPTHSAIWRHLGRAKKHHKHTGAFILLLNDGVIESLSHLEPPRTACRQLMKNWCSQDGTQKLPETWQKRGSNKSCVVLQKMLILKNIFLTGLHPCSLYRRFARWRWDRTLQRGNKQLRRLVPLNRWAQ